MGIGCCCKAEWELKAHLKPSRLNQHLQNVWEHTNQPKHPNIQLFLVFVTDWLIYYSHQPLQSKGSTDTDLKSQRWCLPNLSVLAGDGICNPANWISPFESAGKSCLQDERRAWCLIKGPLVLFWNIDGVDSHFLADSELVIAKAVQCFLPHCCCWGLRAAPRFPGGIVLHSSPRSWEQVWDGN